MESHRVNSIMSGRSPPLHCTLALDGQKRELPISFWPKTGVLKYNNGRECSWPYLIGQHPFSPVLGQKRPGAPDSFYFAQLPPVFGHYMFPTGRLLEKTSMDHKNNEQKFFAHMTLRLANSLQPHQPRPQQRRTIRLLQMYNETRPKKDF